jgi:hypothetical protein
MLLDFVWGSAFEFLRVSLRLRASAFNALVFVCLAGCPMFVPRSGRTWGTFVPVLKISSPLHSTPKLILNSFLILEFCHTTKSTSINALPRPEYDE